MSARWKKIFWLFLVAAAPTVLSLGFSRVEPAGKAMAENARAGKGGQGACCCAGLHGDCCSSGDGNCACGKQGAVLNRFQLLEPLAFSQTSQDTEKPAPQEKKVTPEAKTLGGEIRKALLNHQKALADAYICCTMPGCVFCQTAGESCPCGTNLRKGEPVCPECWGGWQAGQGAIPAVKREDVKVFPKETLKTLYEKRAKKFEQALEGRPREKE